MVIDIKNISPPRLAYNTPCIACGAIKTEFLRFGVIPICHECYNEDFELVTEEGANKNYKMYLDKYLGKE